MTLTESQLAAVEGPPATLVIAGPGAGKTNGCLLPAIVKQCLDDPTQAAKLIVVTFTNAAASQLRDKLDGLGIAPAFVGTLHALCAHMARKAGQVLTIITEEQSEAMIAETITLLRSKASRKAVREALAGATPGPKETPVVAAYRKRLAASNATDYEGLLDIGLSLAPGFGEGWLLYVDEYQDSGPKDAAIYAALKCARRFIIGDPDQSIYGFRGARMENILDLAKSGEWTTFKLEDNFRSRAEIIERADRLIFRNANRVPKAMRAARDDAEADRLHQFGVFDFRTPEQELAALQTYLVAGEWAVLTRYNATRKAILDALRLAGLDVPPEAPVRPDGWNVATALLGLMAAPQSPLALSCYARAIFDAAKAAEITEAIASGKPAPWKLVVAPATWPGMASELERHGLRGEIIRRIHAAYSACRSIDPALILAALHTNEATGPKPRITVTTYHGAKGLEFTNVWLPACEEQPKPEHLEEERRLFFVAMTRAKDRLIISHAVSRQNPFTRRVEKRSASPFVLESRA